MAALGYILVAHVNLLFSRDILRNTVEYIYLGLIFFAAGSWFYSLKQERYFLNVKLCSPTSLMGIAGIFLLCIGVHYLHLERNSLWLDEYTQMQYSLENLHISGIIQGAATEQQPPLDYYLSAFSGSIIPGHILGYRLHNIIFLSAAAALMAIFIWGRTRNFFYVSLGVALFVFHPTLYFYATEARPYGLGVFWGIAFFISLLELDPSKKESFRRHFIIQIIFVLSIGLQPQVLMMSAFLTLLFTNGIKKITPWWYLWISSLTAFLFIPFFYYLYTLAEAANQFQKSFSNSFFDSFNLTTFYDYLGSIHSFGFFYIYLLLIPLVFKKVNKLTLVFSVVFVALFYSVYFSTITWFFSEKYIVAFIPLLIFIICEVLELTEQFISTYSQKAKIILRGALLCQLLFLIFNTTTRIHQNFEEYRVDWKGFYENLSPMLASGDQVQILTLNNTYEWRMSYFIGMKVYADPIKQDQFVPPLWIEGTDDIYPDLEKFTASENNALYLLSPKKWSQDNINPGVLKESKDLEVLTINGVRIFKIMGVGSAWDRINYFASAILAKYPNEEWSLVLHELKIKYALQRNDMVTAKKHLATIRSLSPEGNLSNDGMFINKKQYLKKYINYYEKLIN
jgi:hypothetical protein